MTSSHVVLAKLVGTGKRVLDVGCSTGDLAALIASSGNKVSGIEMDAGAATIAESRLEQVVVGDVESMDLTRHFPPSSFDVLVFADVLSQLRDPVSTLRRVAPLLAPDGSVVISLPNITHTSIRLSLLEGRFEYRPLGSLDETHLRFFTRSTAEAMVRSAGFLAIEMHRMPAEADISGSPVGSQAVPPQLVDYVRSDPESETYEFVFRAVPVATSDRVEIGAELLACYEELEALREQVKSVLEAADGLPLRPALALLADGGEEPWSQIRHAVTALEMRRRLRGVALQFVTGGSGVEAAWNGEPVARVSDADRVALDRMVREYAAVLVAEKPASAESGRMLQILVERGCAPILAAADPTLLLPLAPAAFGGSVRRPPLQQDHGLLSVPDPLVLCDRLIDRSSLDFRLEYLRMAGQLDWRGEYVLVAVNGFEERHGRELASITSRVAGDTGASPVVLASGTESGIAHLRRMFSGVPVFEAKLEIDVLALLAGAEAVITDFAPAAAMSLALRRPLLALGPDEAMTELALWAGVPELVVSSADDLSSGVRLALDRAADPAFTARLRESVELGYDDLARVVTGRTARTLARTTEDILADALNRTRTLEAVNEALRARMVSERKVVGSYVKGLADKTDKTSDAAARREWVTAQKRAEAAERSLAELRRELDAIMATKTMRMLAPARRVYQRLRGSKR